jgi:hypothetical protein
MMLNAPSFLLCCEHDPLDDGRPHCAQSGPCRPDHSAESIERVRAVVVDSSFKAFDTARQWRRLPERWIEMGSEGNRHLPYQVGLIVSRP